MADSTARIALVTGANKGIGFEVSRQLARAGCLVLMSARNRANGEAAAQKLLAEQLDVRFIEIDLLNHETIHAASAQIEAEYGHLDILVNNAGISVPGDGLPSAVTVEALSSSMQTNYFGPVVVTQAMLPLLRNASHASIVNVSSGLGSITLHNDPTWAYAPYKFLAYCASKAALNMFTVQLAWELRDTAIKVNSADPGYTATDMNRHSGHQTIEEGSAETIRLALLPAGGPTGTFSDSKGPEPW
jgi:NAD(P)-dependent dehydrogenase (short-subunit alcohol dehydrogenase family)